MLDASFGFKRSKVAGWRGDNGHATTHEVNHERREAIEFALQPVVQAGFTFLNTFSESVTGELRVGLRLSSVTSRGDREMVAWFEWKGRLQLGTQRPLSFYGAMAPV